MDGREEEWSGKAEPCLRGQTELDDGRFTGDDGRRGNMQLEDGDDKMFSKKQLGRCFHYHHGWSVITVENCVGGIRNSESERIFRSITGTTVPPEGRLHFRSECGGRKWD